MRLDGEPIVAPVEHAEHFAGAAGVCVAPAAAGDRKRPRKLGVGLVGLLSRPGPCARIDQPRPEIVNCALTVGLPVVGEAADRTLPGNVPARVPFVDQLRARAADVAQMPFVVRRSARGSRASGPWAPQARVAAAARPATPGQRWPSMSPMACDGAPLTCPDPTDRSPAGRLSSSRLSSLNLAAPSARRDQSCPSRAASRLRAGHAPAWPAASARMTASVG